MDTRKKELNEMLPRGVKTVLDIGSQGNLFDRFQATRLDIKDAEIIQDLNKSQKISLKNKSVDVVVLSQILEHLVTVYEIIKESKRVSKRYILVGLPNELKLDNRIKFLFGKVDKWEGQEIDDGYYPLGHKHFFTIKRIELFIKRFFGEYEKKIYIFGVSGGRFLPLFLKRFLANKMPTLFTGEAYYLIDVKKRKEIYK